MQVSMELKVPVAVKKEGLLRILLPYSGCSLHGAG